MTSDLEKKLLTKYPKIFRQHTLPYTETAMCWFFEHGDGWYELIDHLCFMLQFNTDRNRYPQVEAVQVKEKYGRLCFYYQTGPTDDKYRERKCGSIDGLVSFAESFSETICEKCGTNKDVSTTDDGWVRTLCDKCLNNGK